ncbi:uncharacterized protein LOC131180601 [Hevea brasiliensis]|uniref:uncharacterized protein LOC131180601 n=1 Tax=Hevea brasiliensis TaxID=3981 RepID=UPI0025E6C1E8|nr:uncharacterized protein LOC131180601 [Hevea brasiliensis]
MPFKRYVEIGRVTLISYGKDYGKLNVIADVIEQNQVAIGIPDMAIGKKNIRKKIKMVVMRTILAGKVKIRKVRIFYMRRTNSAELDLIFDPKIEKTAKASRAESKRRKLNSEFKDGKSNIKSNK